MQLNVIGKWFQKEECISRTKAYKIIWFYKAIMVILKSCCVNEQGSRPIYRDEVEQKARQKYIKVDKWGATVN